MTGTTLRDSIWQGYWTMQEEGEGLSLRDDVPYFTSRLKCAGLGFSRLMFFFCTYIGSLAFAQVNRRQTLSTNSYERSPSEDLHAWKKLY